jgi:hypothetical protein
MKKYIEEMLLEELPNEMDGETAPPVASHLFTRSE